MDSNKTINCERIPVGEIAFHPHSFGDPDGRLFWWRGRLLRGISQSRTPFFKQLFDSGIAQELVEQGHVIYSELTDFTLDEYGLVLQHRLIPFVSYPHEWCAAMLKDASIAYIELLKRLLFFGLTLKDTHPWNIVFEGCQPRYVDITSIRARTEKSRHPPYEKFLQYYFYPIALMCHGQERIVKYLLADYEGIRDLDFARWSKKSEQAPFESNIKRVTHAMRKYLGIGRSKIRRYPDATTSQLDYLERLNVEIESIAFPPEWTTKDASRALVSGSLEQQQIQKAIAELAPRSILALGSSTRKYAIWAARSHKHVVSLDKDPTYITQLYYVGRDNNLPLLPLLMDFTDPTPSRGLSSHISVAASERFQCDLVLALDSLRDFVFERKLRFDQIVDSLALFSTRWLVVNFEMVPGDDRPQPQPLWYSHDNLLNVLAKRFRDVKKYSLSGGNQALFVCEK